MNFSGRTTCYEHKFNWEEKEPNIGRECIQNVKFFDVQWSNCPTEVEDEVRKMWADFELGNDHYFIEWHEDLEEDYPIVSAFLKHKGLTNDDKIIIHWWW